MFFLKYSINKGEINKKRLPQGGSLLFTSPSIPAAEHGPVGPFLSAERQRLPFVTSVHFCRRNRPESEVPDGLCRRGRPVR